MKHYKKLLLDALREDGWELKTQVTGLNWWAEEHWYIRSTKENWGFELVLSFMVDPQYEGDIKSQAIYEVVATPKKIKDGIVPEDSVATMDLRKGNFEIKLSEFIDKLNLNRGTANL